jgi:DnaJ homolog subfamily C member 19
LLLFVHKKKSSFLLPNVMIALFLGLASLITLLAVLGMFSRAQVATAKSALIWAGAIAGVLLAALLFLTGRGAIALSALIFLGPMLWSWIAEGRRPRRRANGPGPRPRFWQPPPRGGMTRAEAYEILGLHPGATPEEIRAAHRRLMQAAHPDRGGSDWLAARINQARDVLLN